MQFRLSWLLHRQLSAVCQHVTEVRSRTGARLQLPVSFLCCHRSQMMWPTCCLCAESAGGARCLPSVLSWMQTISWIHVTLLYINIHSDPTCRWVFFFCLICSSDACVHLVHRGWKPFLLRSVLPCHHTKKWQWGALIPPASVTILKRTFLFQEFMSCTLLILSVISNCHYCI